MEEQFAVVAGLKAEVLRLEERAGKSKRASQAGRLKSVSKRVMMLSAGSAAFLNYAGQLDGLDGGGEELAGEDQVRLPEVSYDNAIWFVSYAKTCCVRRDTCCVRRDTFCVLRDTCCV
eukprot:1569389-Pyramimonas_sp.AAC.2